MIVTKYDIAIIGGGILGTAISFWISSMYNAKVCVIEKEDSVARHTSSLNTGVVHSPFYLDPKKRRISAVSSLLSRDLWKVVAKKNNIPWLEVGTVEIALDGSQHRTLEKYMKWASQNGIPEEEISLLSSEDLAKKEPNLTAHSGIFCSRDVSTDYRLLTVALKNESERSGTKFIFGQKVVDVKTTPNPTLILSNSDPISANFVINCCGGYSLKMAKKFGLGEEYDDLHFRGEYWIANKNVSNLVNTNIYTVAKFPEFPFLDPHWIKRANGNTEIGPNAVPVATPETYEGYTGELSAAISKIREIFRGNVKRLLANPNFLSLISKEFLSSVSKTVMVHRVQQFIHSVNPDDFTQRGTAGIRTPVISPQGEFVKDILELNDSHSFHIVNYNSPGATGAPAYSAYIVNLLTEKGFLDYSDRPKKTFWNFNQIIDAF